MAVVAVEGVAPCVLAHTMRELARSSTRFSLCRARVFACTCACAPNARLTRIALVACVLAAPKAAVDKHKSKGMSLILSDEFKDLARTKSIFVFEDIPYGVPGNTGDVNIVSVYSSDTISLLPEGGMRLSAFMAPEDKKIFMKGWNGTYNTNYKSDVSLWSWHAPKVTSRINGRFQCVLRPAGQLAPPPACMPMCYG